MSVRSRLILVWLLPILLLSVVGEALFSSARFTAHAAGASITLSETIGPPTSTVTVSGTGYGPTEKLVLKVDNTIRLGSATTDATGAFSTTITIPATLLPGHHTVYAASIESPHVSGHAGFLVRTDWPEFGFDAQHTRLNPYENVLSPANVSGLVLDWRSCIVSCSFFRDSIIASPAVANGMVYVGGTGGHIWAFNAATGARVWGTGPIHRYVTSSPAVANGVVYVGSGAGDQVLALNATTGKALWTYSSMKTSFNSNPTVVNGIVYISSYGGGGHLLAFDATTGVLRWKDYTKDGYGSPTVVNGVVYVARGSNLDALNATTGARLWTYNDSGAAFTSSPAVVSGVVYIGSTDGNVYALNAGTGAKLWSASAGGTLGYSSPAVANGAVYIGSSDHNVYALNASTGAQLWTASTKWVVDSSPAVANGVVYVGSSDGNIYALNAGTGAELWSYSASMQGITSSPAIANGIVYVGSDDGYLYAFHLPSITG